MAISFTRPDPSSPSAVASAAFTTSRKGFEQTEVREFLRMVAAELARLQEREKFLERELRTIQRSGTGASVALDEEIVTRMLGEEAARILHTAREAAAQIRSRAEDGAARLLREATDEAQRLRTEAEIEGARRRNDAAADAESELAMAKQQGREMVNEARAYRERVLSELARRRELARQQIEQLIHGRDRLLQAFERSRAVAVDVMAELTPLGEPTEYVDLSPTTGPVPIVVARRPPQPSADADDTAANDPFHVSREGEVAVHDAEAEPVHLELVSDEQASEAVVSEIARTPADIVRADADEQDDQDEAEDDGAGSSPVEAADTIDDAAGSDQHEPVAPVIELFTGGTDTSDRSAAPDADAHAATPDETTAIELSEEHDATSAADRGAVDDLFARLRAARAGDVAQRVIDGESATPLPVDDHTGRPVDTGAAPEQPADADDVEFEFEIEVEFESLVEDSVFAVTPEAPVSTAGDAGGDDSPFVRRDAALTPIIVAAARKLKRVLADEQNEVLHALRGKEPVRGLDAILPAASEHVSRYVAAIEQDLIDAAVAGAMSMGATTAAAKKDVKRASATQQAAATLGTELVDPLRERVARHVSDADGDNGELANLVRVVYREWKTQRIDENLDDVVRTAFGRGAFAAAGDGAPIHWVVDPSGPACPDAEDNALAGVVRAGEPFPTDHLCAPAHSGCTCMIARAREI